MQQQNEIRDKAEMEDIILGNKVENREYIYRTRMPKVDVKISCTTVPCFIEAVSVLPK